MKLSLLTLLVFVTLSLSAQPKITYDKTQHDFGKVREDGGLVSHDFTFKNSGTAALIIQNVQTTCGCTTPEWTKQPINPGETGFIKVSYDVKGRPGPIDKSITVITNTSPARSTLKIVGEVIPSDRSPSEEFRHQAGEIRLSEKHLSFNRVYSHEKPAMVIGAYNPGTNPVKISFINLPSYIKAEVSPATIKQGERANIRVTYDASRKNEWGSVNDQISLILNDKKAIEHKLTVTATIEEDFSRWTTAQIQNAPEINIERNIVDAGKVKKGEKKTYSVKVTNSGKNNLLIRRAESNSAAVTVNAPKEIKAGASADLTITFDSAGQSSVQNRSITMITNDPKNPLITLRFRAEVVE